MPWLDAARVGDLRLPALEWLVARGRRADAPVADWRGWLADDWLGAAGGLAMHPAGPCVRAAAGLEASGEAWACLRPVHLLAAIDHLQVDAAPVHLEAGDRATLVADLARHFAGTDYAFLDVSGPDWLLGSARPLEVSSCAPDALPGRNLRELMPRGADSAAIASLMNEVQMLLHEHPVNVARTSRGVAPVNGLWPWGWGHEAPVGRLELPVLATDDAWLEAAWRVHGGVVHGIDRVAALLRDGVPRICVGAVDLRADDPAALERDCFEPLRRVAATGAARMRLRLGAHAWSIGRHARWRAWRRVRPLGEVLG